MSTELRQIKARVPAEFKARWRTMCASMPLSANSALVRAMSRFMGEKGHPTPFHFVSLPESRDATRIRQEVRLAGSEVEAIDKLAQTCGTSRRKYIVNLVRGHLLREPQLGMTELAAIGESNKQLAAIGRHFNQIAKKLNSGENVEARAIAHALNDVKEEISEHLAYVHVVMRSNIDRTSIVETSNDDHR